MDTSTADFEIVKVTWHDAHSVGGSDWDWLDDDEDDGPMVVVHIGFLMPVDNGGKENHVTLCFGMTQDDALDSRIHIPSGMVVGIERLISDGKRGLDRPTAIPEKSRPSRSRGRRTSRRPR